MTRYVVDSNERNESKGKRSNSRNKTMIWSSGETSSRFSEKRSVIPVEKQLGIKLVSKRCLVLIVRKKDHFLTLSSF